MMLYCRLLGAVLLVCTGFAAGQAYCQRLWAQWRAVCGFERLLTYLADQLAFCALPSAELLAAFPNKYQIKRYEGKGGATIIAYKCL